MLARAIDKAKRTVERTRGLRALQGDGDPTGRVIAGAIRAARDQALAPDERAWVDRIEALRTRLNGSTREITRIDFGAGRPDESRDERTMNDGVRVVETLGEVARNASKSPFWCRFLFALVRGARPASGIEMGAAVGISASYQTAALRLNGRGRFATLEGAPSLAEIACANLHGLGLDDVDVVVGRFSDTLPSVLAARRPLDYVFVDGHHDGDATVAYFEMLLPHLAPRAFLVFDDVAWSDGMRRAWKRIAYDERVSLAVDLGAIGVAVVDAARPAPRRYRIPLH
jgi:predicted O-methyltransferase YrrM